MDLSLPDRPNLDQLRRQAKELRDAARAGEPAALERIRRSARIPPRATVSLSAAQLVLAREYGFPSWPRLKAEVETLARTLTERVDAFLSACIEDRRGQAARLLQTDPRIATFDIRTAATLGEAGYVRTVIERDPAAALRQDRRRGWPPLLYVCHSRWHRIDPGRADGMLEVARLLLDAGASPDTHNRLPSRHGYRSALFGAAGIADNPAIARLLLERGANPNDDESLYHAAYQEDPDCLRLLVEHGATVEGTNAFAAALRPGNVEGIRILLETGGDPGRRGAAEEGLEGQLGDRSWNPLAAAVDDAAGVDVVTLLLEAGADPNLPCRDGRSQVRTATRLGACDVGELLLRYGARDDATDPDRFLGACMRADRAEAERLRARDPGLLERAVAEDPAVLVRAVTYADAPALRLMLDLGVPVDVSADDGGTALHEAAYLGRAELVRLLLDRGADVESRDGRWDAAPLGWATVGSGERPQRSPHADWVATVNVLLDAGASTDGAWIDRKPPGEDVADLLHIHGASGAESQNRE